MRSYNTQQKNEALIKTDNLIWRQIFDTSSNFTMKLRSRSGNWLAVHFLFSKETRKVDICSNFIIEGEYIMKMKEVAKVLLAFGILGTILFFFVGADGGPFWSWILFFVFATMLVVGICLNSSARKKEQQNTNQTNSLAQAQGALAEREAMIAKMRANGMSDEDIQKYLH